MRHSSRKVFRCPHSGCSNLRLQSYTAFLLHTAERHRLEGPKVWSFRSLLIFSAFLRVFLIVYGEWQDAHMEVKYTDADYLVFSEAAALVVAGKSPYKRSTYRYSPLIAFLLAPNSFIHQSWGKFIFSGSDLLVGYFIRAILNLRGVPENLTIYSVIVWLFNPVNFIIGTRGKCEPIVCAILLWIIICLMRGNVFQGAVWYGLLVHMRIYLIIYALPIVILLDPFHFPRGKKPSIIEWSSRDMKPGTSLGLNHNLNRLWGLFSSIFTRSRILFGLVSATMFFFLSGIFFYLYEWEFLNEALWYHLSRTDPRHEFSLYFYHMYQNYELEFSVIENVISFLPQLIVQVALISRFAQDFQFCFFAQTVAFVAFNQVITAQYFMWFFSLLPLILPWSKMKLKWEGISCVLFWMGAQIHLLFWVYMLEYKGKQVLIQLWTASLLFVAANISVMVTIILRHSYSPVFKRALSSLSA